MDRKDRFRELHAAGFFVIPNPWDVGSAVRFATMGFPAVATTSSGLAASLGREDQQTSFEELCTHVEQLTAAVTVPISVDGERLYARSLDDIAANVATLAEVGAAGVSIEDYDPATGEVDDIATARDRVEVAASAAHEHGLTLTARAENHLYGLGDLDDTVARLTVYRDAGADVLYAPGLARDEDIERVVAAVAPAAVNVLLRPDGPGPAQLAALGVRRASTGGALARLAYEAATSAARALLDG